MKIERIIVWYYKIANQNLKISSQSPSMFADVGSISPMKQNFQMVDSGGKNQHGNEHKVLLARHRANGNMYLPEMLEYFARNSKYKGDVNKLLMDLKKSHIPSSDIERFVRYIRRNKSSHLNQPAFQDKEYDEIASAHVLQHNNYSPSKKEAFIIIGLPGTGKTTYIDQRGYLENATEIDSDIFKPYSPHYSRGYGASLAHADSTELGERAIRKAVELGQNVVVTLVGINENYVYHTINALKHVGYTVHLTYMHIPPQQALERVKERYQRTHRYVPENYINENAHLPEKTFHTVKSLADKSEWVDSLNLPKYNRDESHFTSPGNFEFESPGSPETSNPNFVKNASDIRKTEEFLECSEDEDFEAAILRGVHSAIRGMEKMKKNEKQTF